MAHRVKCSICGETFDRDKIDFIATAARRYAHKSCYEKQQGELSEDEQYKQRIFEYVSKLFKNNYSKKRIEYQLEKMLKENREYTYSGVFKTLVYWYEVKQGDVAKSHYSINIVPYVYADAREYYRQMWLIEQTNADKNIEEYIPKTKMVTIKNPQRIQKVKERRFEFLKEEKL